MTEIGGEQFFSNFRVLVEEGYLKAMHYSFFRKKDEDEDGKKDEETTCDPAFLVALSQLKKGSELNLLAEALYFRFHDPCDGECRTAHRR